MSTGRGRGRDRDRSIGALRRDERIATKRVYESMPSPTEFRDRGTTAAEWRRQADLDRVMAACKAHARRKCSEVWPGGTVDPDEIAWSWSNRLQRSAGYCYWSTRSEPVRIKLAPGYYYTHGLDDLLSVVRHELIHAWQSEHPDGGSGVHGPKFRQWLDDMDTHRHCERWSK